MPICFEGNTADEVWYQAVTALLDLENGHRQESRLGYTQELLHSTLSIRNPRHRWVHSRLPGINPAFAIAEVFWILSGSNVASQINFWNPVLPHYAGSCEHYHGAYGFRLRNQFGFDQIVKAYETLRDTPNSRQVVLQIWDAQADFPVDGGKPAADDIPCNVCGMLKLRDGKLDWVQIMRSNDIFRGTPYNFIQFTMLQEIVSGWLECGVGEYVQFCDSMHFYESDLNKFSIAPQQENILSTDDLALPKKESDEIISAMTNLLGKLTCDSLNETRLCEYVYSNGLPEGYKNMLLIAGADSARRRGWGHLSIAFANECSNPALVAAWTEWNAHIELDNLSRKKI
jgi:thymidylate synthase